MNTNTAFGNFLGHCRRNTVRPSVHPSPLFCFALMLIWTQRTCTYLNETGCVITSVYLSFRLLACMSRPTANGSCLVKISNLSRTADKIPAWELGGRLMIRNKNQYVLKCHREDNIKIGLRSMRVRGLDLYGS